MRPILGVIVGMFLNPTMKKDVEDNFVLLGYFRVPSFR